MASDTMPATRVNPSDGYSTQLAIVAMSARLAAEAASAAGSGAVKSRAIRQAGINREVLFVPPSMPATDLLVRMQASRTHLAIVIDEYGGSEGLVSIEDLVEVIVGDIAELETLLGIDLSRTKGKRKLTRWPGSPSNLRAACPPAAKSSATLQASNSKSSTPTHGA